MVVPVTLPVEPLLPVALVAVSSRLNENLFGLSVRFATLSLTYCCNELKKLIVDERDDARGNEKGKEKKKK